MNSFSAYMKLEGHEVSVLRFFIPSGKQDIQVPEGVDVYDIGCEKDTLKNLRNLRITLKKLFKIKAFDLVLFSGGPFFSFMLAPLCKIRYKIPYVLDFRDPWAYDERINYNIGNMRKRLYLMFMIWLYRRIESVAVRHAACIVTVTEEESKIMGKIYPYKKNIFTVRNGYDERMTSRVDVCEPSKDKVLGVFGKLCYYSPKLACETLSAVEGLANEGLSLQILHIGQEETGLKEVFQKTGFDISRYHCMGYMPYEKGLALLSQARVLVIVYSNEIGLGTKLYDYIYLNRPIILAAKKKSELARFVTRFKNAFVCETAQEIKDTLKHILDDNIYCLDPKIDLHEYSRLSQNKKYEIMLESVKVTSD